MAEAAGAGSAERPVVEVGTFGDAALLVTVTGSDPESRWALVHALADGLEAAAQPGVLGTLPTYDTLLVELDVDRADRARVAATVDRVAATLIGLPAPPAGRVLVVPVVYGGEHGPDLTFVADTLGVSNDEVVALHSAEPLTVRCLAAAGSAMMDGPAFTRPVPRLPEPRTVVPAGSVTVAGRQAIICPTAVPSGWRILGRSPLRFLDLEREVVTAYRPRDRIRFVPIPARDWDRWAGAAPRVEP